MQPGLRPAYQDHESRAGKAEKEQEFRLFNMRSSEVFRLMRKACYRRNLRYTVDLNSLLRERCKQMIMNEYVEKSVSGGGISNIEAYYCKTLHKNREKIIDMLRLIFILLLFVTTSQCKTLDREILPDARRALKEYPIEVADRKDTIKENLILRTNNYFIYTTGRMVIDKRRGPRFDKRSYHGYAGNYILKADTLILYFFKNYRPTYLPDSLVYTNDSISYFFNRDPMRKRSLKVKKLR